MTPKLLFAIHSVAQSLPLVTVESITRLLATSSKTSCPEALKAAVLNQLANPNFRRLVTNLLETWQQDAKDLDSHALAAALTSAAYGVATAREALSVELVWTGPESPGIPLRRTDQVLLQLIREAKQELTIISFAVYKVPEIAQALVAAMNRGVSLRILAETPQSGAGKIGFSVSAALGAEVIQRAKVFVWPKQRRPINHEGRYGSLHVKCAIADSKHLFISSANLTEYALTLNMEMGLLVKSEDLAGQVKQHIDHLIQQGILIKVLRV